MLTQKKIDEFAPFVRWVYFLKVLISSAVPEIWNFPFIHVHGATEIIRSVPHLTNTFPKQTYAYRATSKTELTTKKPATLFSRKLNTGVSWEIKI